MPSTLTYPGVYIEEVPSEVRTIPGVATSIAAFIDYFKYGIPNEPVHLFSLADFERELGGLDSNSEASYAIQQFFLNGGQEAYAVRTVNGASAASVDILSAVGGAVSFTVQAGRINGGNPGEWGNSIRILIDPISANSFNMTVQLVERQGTGASVKATETFRNLSMTPGNPNFVSDIINDRYAGSKLIWIPHVAAAAAMPVVNGTMSGPLANNPAIQNATPQINVQIGTTGPSTADLKLPANPTLTDIRNSLENAIRAARPDVKSFAGATVSIFQNRLLVRAGDGVALDATISFSEGGVSPSASRLGLIGGKSVDALQSAAIAAGAVFAPGNLDVTIGGSQVTLALLGGAGLVAAAADLEAMIVAAAGGVAAADAILFSNTIVVADQAASQIIVVPGGQTNTIAFADPAGSTLGAVLGLVGAGTMIKVYQSINLPAPAANTGDTFNIQIGPNPNNNGTGSIAAGTNLIGGLATELQGAIRGVMANPTFTNAKVLPYTSGAGAAIVNYLVAFAGVVGDQVVFSASPADPTTVADLGLDGVATSNVQYYGLGAGGAIPNTAQGVGTVGANGNPPGAGDLIGSANQKTGIYALEKVDLFNLLCIPRIAHLANLPFTNVASQANAYCEQRRAFFILDVPVAVNEVEEMRTWIDGNNGLRNKNNAIYFPRIEIGDPLNEFRPRMIGNSGTVAGLFARTDTERGVWKSAAGTEATLRNVKRIECPTNDAENGSLNTIGINCLRNFPIYGNVIWGARTGDGSDQAASQWKFSCVRRLALYIEESLYRGTKWVVFEPNDEPLWSQIRLNVGSFMHGLFRQHAFQGLTSREAYLVKCDKETTTQADIDRGIVNILVGFKPLKPAEYVVIRIQQLAGQLAT